MEKRGRFVLFFVFVFFIFACGFIFSAEPENSLHLTIQTLNSTGSIVTGSFDFIFNISTTGDCANVIYSNSTTLTTDSRGIISYYLENVNLNFSEQYWLCYYRDGVLINSSKMARNPYSFRSFNVTLSGVEINSNLEMGGYNVTADTFFGKWNSSSLYAPNTTLAIQSLLNGADLSLGNVTFNGGWESNGVSVSGGDLWAKTIYVYNISSININNLNVNGSFIPSFDDTFNLGSSELRWKDLFLSGQIYSNGTGNNYFLGNLGIGIVPALAKLQTEGDIYTTGGLGFYQAGDAGARNVLYRGGSDFTILRNYNQQYTLLQLWSPSGVLGSEREATLALVRGDEPDQEYLDLYNNGYTGETQFGIRIQKRGTGVYRDFVFDQYDGVTKTPLMILKSDGKIGIGTLTPSQTLDVRGEGNFSGIIYYNNETPITALNDTYYSDEVYINQNSSRGFNLNENQLNATISQKISETTAVYLPVEVATLAGTYTDGNITSLSDIDGNTYNVTETDGTSPGWDIRINFTGVTDFSSIALYQQYEGATSHTVSVQLYNWNTEIWDTFGTYTNENIFIYNSFVLDPPALSSDYINNTNVSLRLYHSPIGISTHLARIDYVALNYVSGAVSSGLQGSGAAGKLATWLTETSLTYTNDIYAPNTTAGIQSLINSTGVYTYAYNQTTETFNLYNSSWDNRGLISLINTTGNIGTLYNLTASQIANLSISQGGLIEGVTAGNGLTGGGTTGTVTLDVASHAGTAGSIGTINIGADTIGVNLGTTSITAYRGDLGDTAYSERRQWDGGSTNLVASTGRTSLGLVAGGTGDIWVEKAGDTMTGGLTISSGSLNIAGLTASRLVATDASKNLVSTMTRANFISSISDASSTGSGDFVFATSPSITTLTVSSGGASITGNTGISGTVRTGSTTETAWNQFGTGTKDNANIADVNDVYISDDLEVDGTAFIPAMGGTPGAYWTVGDVAENMLTIQGRNNLLCNAGNKTFCTGKAYNHSELDYGDVVCIDPKYGQVIMKCTNSSTDIPIGVISSTAKIIIGGSNADEGFPVGVAGFVPTKISNENGNVYPGDLLVLSETKSGYAMKKDGNKKMGGMILGSAYDYCTTGAYGKWLDECEIPVLIALSYTGNVEKEIIAMKKSLCQLGVKEWCQGS